MTQPTSTATEKARPPLLTAWISDHDTSRWVTIAAVGGVTAAIVLAIVGGLPFDLPMPTHAIGWVEPSCGLTRGSTAIARGDFATAWHYNPLSFAVMAFAAYGLVRAAIGSLTHRWVNIKVRATRAILLVGGVALVAFWLYQQTNADFIINSRI